MRNGRGAQPPAWTLTVIVISAVPGGAGQEFGQRERRPVTEAALDCASALVNYILGLAGQYAAGARLLAGQTVRRRPSPGGIQRRASVPHPAIWTPQISKDDNLSAEGHYAVLLDRNLTYVPLVPFVV